MFEVKFLPTVKGHGKEGTRPQAESMRDAMEKARLLLALRFLLLCLVGPGGSPRRKVASQRSWEQVSAIPGVGLLGKPPLVFTYTFYKMFQGPWVLCTTTYRPRAPQAFEGLYHEGPSTKLPLGSAAWPVLPQLAQDRGAINGHLVRLHTHQYDRSGYQDLNHL